MEPNTLADILFTFVCKILILSRLIITTLSYLDIVDENNMALENDSNSNMISKPWSPPLGMARGGL